jgi:hypothetical protein
MIEELPCFFCRERATLLGYYSKFYPELNRGTRENPTLFCESCWKIHRYDIGQVRGGMEGVWCIRFEDLAKMPKKKIAWMLSKRGFEINHLANKTWRKQLWRIYYLHQKKRMIDDDPERNIEVSAGT